MKRNVWVVALSFLSLSSVALAIDEEFCLPPGSTDCSDDKLSVTFPAGGNTSELSLPAGSVGQTIEANVVLDAKTTGVQGYTYGVQHDTAILEILEATYEGADPLVSFPVIAGAGVDFNETAIGEAKKGFIQAVVVTNNKIPPLTLPVKDGIKVAIAKYKVNVEPPSAGTKIGLSNNINPEGSPATEVVITAANKSKRPKTVGQGVVKGVVVPPCALPDFGFYFGPVANAANFAITPTPPTTNVKVSMRNKKAALGFSLGIRRTGSTLTFEGNLNNPVVELVITEDETGAERTGDGLKGNQATGAPVAPVRISEVKRGAALIANDPGDFFGPDIPAANNGDVATVGYVAVLSGPARNIPAVADPGTTCGSNAILEVIFTDTVQPTRFNRGDANGDSKINVTDGVLVAQNIFFKVAKPGLVKFNCDDMLDVDDNGRLEVADPLLLLRFIFLHGPAPSAPFRACGADSAVVENPVLTCAQANCQ